MRSQPLQGAMYRLFTTRCATSFADQGHAILGTAPVQQPTDIAAWLGVECEKLILPPCWFNGFVCFAECRSIIRLLRWFFGGGFLG